MPRSKARDRGLQQNRMERIGTLELLRRYPVKSMAGEELTKARVTFAGLAGDRVYAFAQNGHRSNFPWMTARQAHEMILFRPRYLDPLSAEDEHPDAEAYAAEVMTPEGETFQLDDPAFLKYMEHRFGRPLRLRFSERSMTNSRPVSLFGLATLRALSEETGMALDARRFRANFYARWDPWDNDRPFFEDEFAGRELQIGDTLLLQVVKKNTRCPIITLDPENAAPSPGVLENVTRNHGGCAGIYCAVLREGIARVGDPICLV